MSQLKKANATPTKKLFIDLLTRDISLVNCVLDLIDNSIDSMVSKTDFDAMDYLLGKNEWLKSNKYQIDILFNDYEFSIEDNGSGISLQLAEEKIFRFWNQWSDEVESDFWLSVYGIWMKRAIFKIGKELNMVSKTQSSTISINNFDIETWKHDEESQDAWKIPFQYEENSNKNTGTKITVSNLNNNIFIAFKGNFEQSLMKAISKVYNIYLKAWITITVNWKSIETDYFKLSSSDGKYNPSKKILNIDWVEILIITWLTPREASSEYWWWYVLCNWRVILNADKTDNTWWWRKFRNFHVTVNHFIGIIYFRSKVLKDLPWNTTKDWVDINSIIYQKALNEMATTSKPVIDFLWQMYGWKEDLDIESIAHRNIIDDAKSISIEDVIKKEDISFKAEPSKPILEDDLITISYKKNRKDVEIAKSLLWNKRMSNKTVGEQTFEYFIDNES